MWGISRSGHLIVDTAGQRHSERVRLGVFLSVVGGVGLFTAGAAFVTSPQPFSLALLGVVLVGWAAFVRPATGVYSIVFFSLVADSVATPWWPFTKNLSMRESIFFVHDKLAIAPLDLVLGASWAAFLLRSLVEPGWRFRRGRVLAPVLVLGGFVMMGIVRGISTGGQRNIALFEFRPLLYLIGLYALIPNVLVTRTQFRIAFGLGMVAVSVHSLFALRYYRSLPAESRELISSLAEHPATLTMNVLFIFILGLSAFGAPRSMRRVALVLAIPVVFAFFLAQRRAGVVALIGGLLIFTIVLFFENRRAFMKVVPAARSGIGGVRDRDVERHRVARPPSDRRQDGAVPGRARRRRPPVQRLSRHRELQPLVHDPLQPAAWPGFRPDVPRRVADAEHQLVHDVAVLLAQLSALGLDQDGLLRLRHDAVHLRPSDPARRTRNALAGPSC